MSAADHHDVLFKSLRQTLEDAVGPERIAACKAILEFGCGRTGYIHRYKLEGQAAYGVDLDDLSEHWAARGVQYIKSDGRTIDLQDRSIDLIVSHSAVEHVEDLENSIREMDRILKPGGIAYITVSPLYYSPLGAHIRRLDPWEHLRPGSEHFEMTQPINREGAFLNKLTVSEMLGYIGQVPWDIVKLVRKYAPDTWPEWLASYPQHPLDLVTKEFRLVCIKGSVPRTF